MTKLKKVIVPALVVGALTLGVAPPTEATPLPNPGVVPAVGIAAPGGVQVPGASVFYPSTCFAPAGTVCEVGASVLVGADTGTLDFYYQVTNNSEENDIHRLTGTSFAGFSTDVWFVIDGSSVPCSACPGGFFEDGTQAPEDIDRDAPGNVVGFDFENGFELDPGETSRVLLIRTDAITVVPGFVSVINGGANTDPAFAPGVPEPASLLLFGIGLLGTGAAMRRKRKA